MAAEMAANGTEELAEELVDYEEEEAAEADAQPAAKPGEQVKKGYVGIHSSGFKARRSRDRGATACAAALVQHRRAASRASRARRTFC